MREFVIRLFKNATPRQKLWLGIGITFGLLLPTILIIVYGLGWHPVFWK